MYSTLSSDAFHSILNARPSLMISKCNTGAVRCVKGIAYCAARGAKIPASECLEKFVPTVFPIVIAEAMLLTPIWP